jgi:hypothetical protein
MAVTNRENVRAIPLHPVGADPRTLDSWRGAAADAADAQAAALEHALAQLYAVEEIVSTKSRPALRELAGRIRCDANDLHDAAEGLRA